MIKHSLQVVYLKAPSTLNILIVFFSINNLNRMFDRITRSQGSTLPMSFQDFDGPVMKTVIQIFDSRSGFFLTSLTNIDQMNVDVAQVLDFLFFLVDSDVDEKAKYQRLKKIEHKALRVFEMKTLRERERFHGFIQQNLSIRSDDFVSMSEKFHETDVKKQTKAKRYFDIIKSEIYKNNFILKLEDFLRDCEIMFEIRFVIYGKHRARINFAAPLLFNQISGLQGTGTRYRFQLNIAKESTFTGIEFCSFLKENVSPTKLRIVNIDNKLHFLKQRSDQTISQLIVYLKTLEGQGPKSFQNFVRVNYLTQTLHDYIKKKLNRKKVDMNNRKIVKEVAFTIENTEKKLSHLKKNKNKDNFSSNNNFKKRKHKKNILETKPKQNRINVLLSSVSKFNKKNDKLRKGKRDLFNIICYNCNEKKHYKNKCPTSLKEGKAQNR